MFTWLVGSESKPPVLLKYRSSKTFIIITVATAVFTDIFVYGIVVPVLPFALTTRSGVKPESIQTWISIFLAVYGAALLAASPFCGYIADRTTSRRFPLVLGLLALGGSTVLLCVGNSIGLLAAGRVLQGVSAAVVWVVGLALLVDTVGPDGVGQALGYVGLSMSLGLLVAPLLGGIVFDLAGYYAVFAMAFGLIALDIIMRFVMIEKKIAVKWLPAEEPQPEECKKEEVPTASERPATAARDATRDIEMDAIDRLPKSETRPDHLLREATKTPAEEPIPENISGPVKKRRLPSMLYLLSSQRLLNSLWACLILAALYGALDALLPLFVRNTFHWSSIGAGLIFLPIVIVSLIEPIVGYYSDKYGARWLSTAGFVMACPFLILLRLVHENTLKQKVLLCALLALIGTAMSLVLTPMMAEITYAVDRKVRRSPPGFFGKNGAYAEAYSLFNMAFAGGTLVGPLLAGLVNQRAGWGTTTLILGVMNIVTAIPAVIWTGGSIWKKRRREGDEGGAHAREDDGTVSK